MSPINQPGVHSPLGNSAQQTNMMQIPSQSPIGNPGQQSQMMQMPVHSPLGNSMQAPSPLMAQSPIPNAILQSPGNPNMSPYNSQPSPRIGTPHSQPDEVSFQSILMAIFVKMKYIVELIFNQTFPFQLAVANKCTSNESIQSRWTDEVRESF